MNNDIEKSIIKKYRKTIWCRFIKSIKEFKLIKDGDTIGVCISGGKDSFLLAKCMQEIKRHGQINFDLKFICMNPGYKQENLELIKENAKTMNIDLHIFNSNIFDIVDSTVKSPCYLCARMRRGYLYNEASLLGCNKIALGHHFDDVVDTILMSLLYASDYKTMLPILKSTNYEGISLIRPLYYVREDDIISWAKYNNLKFINCACKMTSRVDADKVSKRKEIHELVRELKKTNPSVDYNIFKSAFNVNLDTLIGYHKGEEIHLNTEIDKKN